MVNVLIEADRVELSGEPEAVDVPRDDGSTQRIYRCPRCRIALFSEYTYPAIWFVRAGTLDEPRGVEPDVHIFTKSKVGWVVIPEGMPAFDVFYDLRKVWPAASLERLEAISAQT